MLLWKPSVFIAFPIIPKQSKTKTIPHTAFETFMNCYYWYKTQKVSLWVLWVGYTTNIHKCLFIKNHYESFKLYIVAFSSVIKCFPEKRKRITKWCQRHKKIFTGQEIQERCWKKGKMKSEKYKKSLAR